MTKSSCEIFLLYFNRILIANFLIRTNKKSPFISKANKVKILSTYAFFVPCYFHFDGTQIPLLWQVFIENKFVLKSI